MVDTKTDPLAVRYPILPFPKKLVAAEGQFVVEAGTPILAAGDSGLHELARRFVERLEPAVGVVLGAPTEDASGRPSIVLRRDAKVVGQESYRLSISASGVELAAAHDQGIFYGLQTLAQLFTPPDAEQAPAGGAWTLPALLVEDEPRFTYRGMHLDVGRHFFPLTFLKKLIDELAALKLNVFHWHLTEDQGWRLEIKKYPRLTQVGAWRRETVVGHNNDRPRKFDGKRYGGFYTQDEARELVAYAAERFITIIPEIEMPGHSLAALAAYPELGCTPGPFETATTFGIFDDIYAPSEATFQFLEDVLTEVLAIFPSRYVHIGGDEAKKAQWKASKVAQALMAREGLKDEDELQSYFIRRIEKFLIKHGRRLIGWDEILEGGLAPEATVMSWRGIDGGIAAARHGHDVIMTPTSHCYFDYYQDLSDKEGLAIGGFLPLEKVYDFEPIPPVLSPSEARHVLGAQANVWTEYMPNERRVEHMVFPRIVALAEVVWSPRESRDYRAFSGRLVPYLRALDRRGIKYAPYFYKVRQRLGDVRPRELSVHLDAYDLDNVHYTLDGSAPTLASPCYEEPLQLRHTTTVSAAVIRHVLPRASQPPEAPWRVGAVVSETYHLSLATGAAVVYHKPFSPKYPGSGGRALVDGVRGTKNFGDGNWQGFEGNDLDVTLDLGSVQPLRDVKVGLLQETNSWILLPKRVLCATSEDGVKFSPWSSVTHTVSERENAPIILRLTCVLAAERGRYVRVQAENYGPLPKWHQGAGIRAWLFVDEILVG